jgi:hypothetical protein
MWTEQDARRKIAALFAKAKGAGSAAEAIAFAAKAAELARQYGIDPASLDPDRIGHSSRCVTRGKVPVWRIWLGMAAARLNGCETFRQGGNLMFVGRQGDRVSAELMFDYFEQICDRAVQRHLNEGRVQRPRHAARCFRNSFAHEIITRAESAVAMDRGRETAIAEYMASTLGPKARFGRVLGSEAGRRAAAGVGLSRQAMGSTPLAIAGAA